MLADCALKPQTFVYIAKRLIVLSILLVVVATIMALRYASRGYISLQEGLLLFVLPAVAATVYSLYLVAKLHLTQPRNQNGR